jgi:hypothetical protein
MAPRDFRTVWGPFGFTQGKLRPPLRVLGGHTFVMVLPRWLVLDSGRWASETRLN